jgi:hypothetical protein
MRAPVRAAGQFGRVNRCGDALSGYFFVKPGVKGR